MTKRAARARSNLLGEDNVKLRITALALGLSLLGACADEQPLSPAPEPTDSFQQDNGVGIVSLDGIDELSDKHHWRRATTRYEITLENLTPDTGDGGAQVFSPPVLATHGRRVKMFEVGQLASAGLAMIAEDAVNAPMVERLRGERAVHEVLEGGGVVPPGASATYELEAVAGKGRLSAAFMLVNTNDGFSGVDRLRLPRNGELAVDLYAYDAGSEENTELYSDIPGPCCGSPGVRVPTSEPIAMHGGIQGHGDLDPAKWGWEGPVGRLTIRALPAVYEVTVTNLTPNNGGGAAQPLSPLVAATHERGMHVWRHGHEASDELELVAEDAIHGPMLDMLSASPRVIGTSVGAGPILPGASDSFMLEGGNGARLSLVSMLVNTNDGFVGVDALRLPAQGTFRFHLFALDAGTEENTELHSDIPGPCCGNPESGPDEEGRIRLHGGIQGHGDLDADQYGWQGPAALIEISRVR